MNGFDDSYERDRDLGLKRQKVIAAAMRAMAGCLDFPGTTMMSAELDAAARDLVELLDKPVLCHACGQEKCK